MLGEQEVALWLRAVESAGALEVYLDWLLVHDPVRGELVRKRMRSSELTSGERARERQAWAEALGLDGFEGIACGPLPYCLTIDALRLRLLERVLDRLPFLQINLEFDETAVATALASPVVAKIRRLSFTAIRYEHENYQSSLTSCFGYSVVPALCASPYITRLEALWIGSEPGRECAKLVAAVPFVALRELSFIGAPIGDEGVLAIVGSPIIEMLRRLHLHDSEIGDAGALALAGAAQLQELTIRGHGMGQVAAAALRGMPSLKRLELEPRVWPAMFESLAGFRAHCGEPTMPLADCATCSEIPEHCSRTHVSSIVADYEVDYGGEGHSNDVPPAVAQLETLFAASRDETFGEPHGAGFLGGARDEAVMRCPTCHRLYLYTDSYEHIFARTYSAASYRRLDASALFRSRWCVSRRLADSAVSLNNCEFFRRHAVVRLQGSRTWFSLDEENRLVELRSERLPRWIAGDPPMGLDGPGRARWYAEFVGEVEDPEVQVVDSIAAIRWRDPLTDEQRGQVEAMRAAIRIDEPVVEQIDDSFVVRLWVVSKKRLIYRSMTVRMTGDTGREDVVVAEDLPVR